MDDIVTMTEWAATSSVHEPVLQFAHWQELKSLGVGRLTAPGIEALKTLVRACFVGNRIASRPFQNALRFEVPTSWFLSLHPPFPRILSRACCRQSAYTASSAAVPKKKM